MSQKQPTEYRKQILDDPKLKPPVWKDAKDCFNYLQALDEQRDAYNNVQKYIGKVLELAGGSVEKIFNAIVDLPDGMDGLSKQLSGGSQTVVSGNAPGSPWGYEAFVAEPETLEQLKDDATEKALEETAKKLKEVSEKDAGKWNPLANAVYKVGKKFCITFLPILLKKGAIAASILGAGGITFGAGLPLFLLGVFITYDIEERRVRRAEDNAQLAVRLMGHLNRCRQRAYAHLVKKSYSSAGKAGISEVFEDSVRFEGSGNSKGIRVFGSDVFVTALILEKNCKLDSNDPLGTKPINFHLFYQGAVDKRAQEIKSKPKTAPSAVQLERNLIWAYLFLESSLAARGAPWPDCVGAAEEVKLLPNEVARIVEIFEYIPMEPQTALPMDQDMNTMGDVQKNSTKTTADKPLPSLIAGKKIGK